MKKHQGEKTVISSCLCVEITTHTDEIAKETGKTGGLAINEYGQGSHIFLINQYLKIDTIDSYMQPDGTYQSENNYFFVLIFVIFI